MAALAGRGLRGGFGCRVFDVASPFNLRNIQRVAFIARPGTRQTSVAPGGSKGAGDGGSARLPDPDNAAVTRLHGAAGELGGYSTPNSVNSDMTREAAVAKPANHTARMMTISLAQNRREGMGVRGAAGVMLSPPEALH
jgi:hypothetical protein